MIWADLQNLCRWRYRVMPLNPTLGSYTQKLQREMGTICRLSASAGRPDFYEVDAPPGESIPFLVETLYGSRLIRPPSSSISSTSSPQSSTRA